MKNALIAVTVICAVVVFFSANVAAVKIGDKAPTVEATTLAGKKVSLEDLSDGQALLLFFWATWCPYCVNEIPKLKDAFAGYGSKGLKFLAVNPGINDSREKIERYIEKYKIPYPVVFDKGAKITKSFAVRGAPTYVIVDKDGIVQYSGNKMPQDLAERVKKMTKKSN